MPPGHCWLFRSTKEEKGEEKKEEEAAKILLSLSLSLRTCHIIQLGNVLKPPSPLIIGDKEGEGGGRREGERERD